jgi:hypothetical protein
LLRHIPHASLEDACETSHSRVRYVQYLNQDKYV